ncbi:MAG: carotenoid biosynthesis protein [Pseudonocardiaceae bacterium]
MSWLAIGFGGAGVTTQLYYPLTDGAARAAVTVAAVLLLAGACVTHAAATRGAAWAAGLVLITTGGGLLAEFAGTTTGVPFGAYAYTTDGALGPELGSIPVLIGPAWTFGAYPAWCAAQALTGGGKGAATILVAAWGLASWDLYLDPQMVADGRWVWIKPGPTLPGVPDVPLTNYAGWLLVALLLCGALQVLCGALQGLDRALGAPRPAPDGLPLTLFCWAWLGSAVAHGTFLGLLASAGYGFLGMGLVGVPLLYRLLSDRRSSG